MSAFRCNRLPKGVLQRPGNTRCSGPPNGERGAAIVELALVFPIILAIIVAGIELSRSLHYLQIAATLSREAASIAYRECLGDQPPKTSACLAEESRRLEALSTNILSGIEVIISVYEFDPSGEEYRQLGQAGGAGNPSRYAVENGGQSLAGGIDETVVQTHRRVAIGEVYVPYEPLVPGIPRWFSISATHYYDATII